jgi:hypothetical protein
VTSVAVTSFAVTKDIDTRVDDYGYLS